MGIAHWHEVEIHRRDLGNIRGAWQDLGRAAGSVYVGVRRITLAPGEIPTPEHVHPVEEEIFYVLEGSGVSRQDGKTYEIGAGDCIVHVAMREAHTLRAGDEGLTVLAFGHRMRTPGAYLPNANRYWLSPTWTEVGQQPPPYEAEPELEWPEPIERPGNIVHHAAVEPDYDGEAGRWILMARSAGSVRTGLNWGHLEPGRAGAHPHCHSADEEIFVILEGGGTLELWPSPVRAETMERETHEVRAGHVVSRPPSTGIAHFFRAGDEGMTFLAYGTREPNDVCYYPRSNKIYWRGLGLIARLEPLGYDDGEPED
ncbi:MAG: cupin domain-containing protein [Actinomycetota bacterium]|nr:cupin domain-containing protein [Actinomycetota bacterium]